MPGADLNDISFEAFLANERALDDPAVFRTEPGGMVRLRLINAATATQFWIDLGEAGGQLVAVDGNGCHVSVVIDGTVVRAPSQMAGGGKTPMSITGGLSSASQRSRTDLNDQNAIFIDNVVSANGMAAVEYYRRGANIPIEMQQLDVGCGVLAIWTGGRKVVK